MSQYTAEDIEVLTGLEPVRKRPGMYTDTTRPNHLAQEVIDNSVDEALAGHADLIDVCLHRDGSVTVTDNGRGMPVDIHPEQGVPGVEVILSTLHAGGKFSNKNYQFSGGLHGVGVSVVNALSSQLEVVIRRDAKVFRMTFSGGEKTTDLEVIDNCGQAQYRHRAPVHARPPLFRFGKLFRVAPEARAAGQGGAVPRAAGEVPGRKKGRDRGVVLRGRPDRLPRGCHHRLPLYPGEPFVGSFQRQQ